MSEEEIAKQRMPVWVALSDLFTYREVVGCDKVLERIIDTCVESGYSIELLEKIYYYEVVSSIFSLFNGSISTADSGSVPSNFITQKILENIHNKFHSENSVPHLLEKFKKFRYFREVHKKWRMLKALLKCSLQMNPSEQLKGRHPNILRQRLPAWQGLSELYLHSDIIESSLIVESVIEQCKKSGYSLSMLEKIYAYEVIPALSKGLGGFGFEADNHWMGFEPDFLVEKILFYTNGDLVT